MPAPRLKIAPEVEEALLHRGAVVALETSVLARGPPPPANLLAAGARAGAVRSSGAVPAFLALLEGELVVGADERALTQLADPAAGAAKASVVHLAAPLRERRAAGTTVSASVAIAQAAGIRVLGKGGIGGVHRSVPEDGARRDRSADLSEMSRRKVCGVASGPKVELLVAATAEALEALGVPVVGYATSELPAFFAARAGLPLEHRDGDAAQASLFLRIHRDELGRGEGALLCVPPSTPLPAERVEAALLEALSEGRARGLSGEELTPFLPAALDRAAAGESRSGSVELLRRNARVAGETARELARG